MRSSGTWNGVNGQPTPTVGRREGGAVSTMAVEDTLSLERRVEAAHPLLRRGGVTLCPRRASASAPE
eukprot:8025863-Pyramimonas_sp.AAC.1